MKFLRLTTLCAVTLIISCSRSPENTSTGLQQELDGLPSLKGKQTYLASPFVTAGDRVYLVGFQDGTFPDLGWHISGEMGGIWDHPIKLMDGFTASIHTAEKSFCLNAAESFVNYPMANKHHFVWDEEGISVDRLQFVPDTTQGVVVEFTIVNNTNDQKQLLFSFTGNFDLRPTWLGERTKMVDAQDSVIFHPETNTVEAKDQSNPWYAMIGSSGIAKYTDKSLGCQTSNMKDGAEGTLNYDITLAPHEEKHLPIFIAGSYHSQEALHKTFDNLKDNYHETFIAKAKRYEAISELSAIAIPDTAIMEMYQWLKFNTDWLTRSVPEQGTGLAAGLPDYPWWFGADATYALQGILPSGNHIVAKNTIELLYKLSEKINGNGRIVHEVSTNGSAYNPGNVNETAQYITLVANYYRWTGDDELVRKIYPFLKKGAAWLTKDRDPDGNHYPNGSGMMEIPGLESNLEMIDVAVYTQQAFAALAELAEALNDHQAAKDYQSMSNELAARINNDWWQPAENSFGDFRGTTAEARPILNAAIVRCDTLGKTWAVKELRQTEKNMKRYPAAAIVPHVIYHNWVVNVPMETGVADPAKAEIALAKATMYENPFGAFVTGIDRTEEADSIVLKSRKTVFSYTGAVMTLPTSVLAVGNARYGNIDASLRYMHKLHASFSYALPGSMYEVSPDFGMMTQAWNIYGVAVPVVEYFFGIQPKAYAKTIVFNPHFPESWNDGTISNVKVGDNSIDISVHRSSGNVEYNIRQRDKSWKILFHRPAGSRVTINGKTADPDQSVLTLEGDDLTIGCYAK